MNRAIKLIIASLLALGIFVGGYFTGYGHGFSDREGSLGDATLLVSALKSLRAEQEAEAQKSLELLLDSYIVAFSVTREHFSPYRFFSGNVNSSLMHQIAKYRSEVPSQATDQEVRELIDKTVKGESGAK